MYRKSSTTRIGPPVASHLDCCNHSLLAFVEAKLRLLSSASFAPISFRYLCVKLRQSTNLSKHNGPLARIKMSSARIFTSPPNLLHSSTHGFIRRLTKSMDRGSPCGIPHFLMKAPPMPLAMVLWTLRFS